VEGTRIAFHGSIADARALADAVIALVNRLNDQLMQEGNQLAGEE
jgi:ATP-dependent protease HslVU (ClpYQ) peptidase subunit